MGPNFYRMPFHNGMMLPRTPIYNQRMPIRPRLPVYNQGFKPVTSKPATVTSETEAESVETVSVEQLTSVSTDTNEGVSSAELTGSHEEISVSEEAKS